MDVFLDEYAGHWFITAAPLSSANWFFIRKNKNIIIIIITVFFIVFVVVACSIFCSVFIKLNSKKVVDISHYLSITHTSRTMD